MHYSAEKKAFQCFLDGKYPEIRYKEFYSEILSKTLMIIYVLSLTEFMYCFLITLIKADVHMIRKCALIRLYLSIDSVTFFSINGKKKKKKD